MKAMKSILGGLCLCAAVCGCASPAQKEETAVAEAPAKSDVVIENIKRLWPKRPPSPMW